MATSVEDWDEWRSRGTERLRVAVGTQVRVRGERLAFAVTDLSIAGLRGHCDRPLPLGARIEVDLPRHGWVPAQVRWTRGNACGARFLEEIAPEDFESAALPNPPAAPYSTLPPPCAPKTSPDE